MSPGTGWAIRLRSVVGGLCGAIGVLAILLGVVSGYATRALFNSDAFSARAARCLANEGVSTLVATRITDRVIEERRDLTAFRPILIASARVIVGSPPFRAIVRRAARLSHQTLLSGTGQEIGLTVKDAGVLLRSALSSNPELAKFIPDRMTPTLASLADAPGGRTVVELMRRANRSRIRTLALLGLGLGMLAGSVGLARWKGVALFRIGLALAIGALVVRLLVRFGGHGLALLAKDPLVKDAIVGIWAAFWQELMRWELILGAIGLVLIAAVTSVLEQIHPEAMALALWRWFRVPPLPITNRLLHALALMAGGMVLVLWPLPVVSVLGLILGGVLFFVGLQFFFRLVLRGLPVPEAKTGVTRGGPAFGRMVVIGVFALALAGAGIALMLRRDDATAALASTEACNGSPDLCGRRLDQVVFAASHNSMSSADQQDWMFPNQERGIAAQLEDGVRAFLIDAHYGVPVGDKVKTLLENEEAARKKYEAVLGKEGIDAAMRIRDRLVGADEGQRKVYMCHGFCELGAALLVPVLEQMHEFLIVHPGEVVILIVQDEGVAPSDIAAAFEESGLIDLVYRGPVVPPWPMLREMIDSDQRVLVFAENNAEGVPWYHPMVESIQDTPYTFHDPSEFSCQANRGSRTASLFLVNHWIDTSPAPLPSNAEVVNAYDFLLARARRCQKERGMLPNLIAVDFYRTGDLQDVVREMNGLPSTRVKPSASASAHP